MYKSKFKESINSLQDFKKELKKINFKVSIRRGGSFGLFATFIDPEGKKITGNVFSSAQLDKWKPLIDLLKSNEEDLKKIGKEEGIISLHKI